jgi:hypothetical protein
MLGHVGVLLSSNFVDNGPFALTMDDFWAWFLLAKNVGGSNGSGYLSSHDDWGRPDGSLRVLVVDVGRFEEFTPAAVRNGSKLVDSARPFDRNLRLTYTTDGSWMGSRLQREAGQMVTFLVQAEESDAEDQISRVGHPTIPLTCVAPHTSVLIGSVRS